ncbi:MAG: hypothetical protein OEW08_04965 [Gammaproteobacteria bacterium]|nr:hypothetical protein [Gammaproteobacteria bacterium]
MRVKTITLLGILIGGLSPFAYAAEADPVRIHLKWQYSELKTQMEVYEPKSRPRQRVWKMRSVKEWARVPVTTRLQDDSFDILPGTAKRVVLVMRNDSDQPLRFMAAPHEAEPLGGKNPRFRFKCLCVHQTFVIKPREIWYRVVELRAAPVVADKEITLTHTLMGVPN